MKFLNLIIFLSIMLFFKANAQIVYINETGNSIQAWQDHYDQAPNVQTCSEGVLKDSEKQAVLNYINLIRSIHNLMPVEYDYTGDIYAQKSALIQVANSFLSHTPPTSASCYSQAGYDGSVNSNLFLYQMSGSGSDIDSRDAVTGWMQDNQSANAVDRCGHRRAIINPFVTRISFGRVDGQSNVSSNWGISMALKYMDNVDGDISTRPIEFVAYPYQAYPPALVDKSFYLSFSPFYDMTAWYKNTNIDYTNAQITVKTEDGTPLNVNSIIWDFEGWGAVHNNLRWKVDGLQNEVKYIVDIKNILVNGQSKDYNYWFKLTNNIFNQKPGVPVLSYPADNAQNMSLNLSFSWSVVEYAYKYRFQIAKDFNFQNLVKDIEVTSNGYVMQGLEPTTTYYWRVKAINDIGESEWAQTRTFTTSAPKPDKPTLVYPENNATGISTFTQFKWNNIPGAEKYQIQVSYKSDFSGLSVIIDKNDITDTVYTAPDGKLQPGTTYYWRVASIAGTQKSSYSTSWSFKTKDKDPIPAVATLLSPGNDATDVGLTPLLDWDDIPYALKYKVQISTNFNFAQDNTLVNETVNASNYQVKAGVLQANTKYFWRVQSIGESGASDWSLIWIFNTGNGASVDEKIINNGLVEILPNPASNFVNIKVNKELSEKSIIEIYDLLGNVVLKSNINSVTNSEFLVNMTTLQCGLYYFVIKSDGRFYTGKIEKI